MNPNYSVIIPVYNAEPFIYKAIESLKNQTYTNIEVIIVDDGSTDNSYDKCKYLIENDHRFKLFHKQNGGVSSARNYGIKKSSGEYISFLDSDDYIDKNCFNRINSIIKKYNPEIVRYNYVSKGILLKQHKYLTNTNILIKKEDYFDFLYI